MIRTNRTAETLDYTIGRCAVGHVLVAASGRGVRAVLLGDDPAGLKAELSARYPDAVLHDADGAMGGLLAQVCRSIESPDAADDGPALDMAGTPFQRRVWAALREIPAGATASYAEIARRIGQPRSVRAVARACGANALAVLVPCHRVVRSDGDLSGYRWGVERKHALLARERA